jgi:hypothetical protein
MIFRKLDVVLLEQRQHPGIRTFLSGRYPASRPRNPTID